MLMHKVHMTTLDFMWIAVGKQCALPVGFFTVQQFDICCFRSVMKGLLQLSFELQKNFCINIQ